MIDFEIDPDNYENITVEEAAAHEALINDLNYLIAEGFIDVEEDTLGPRLYPN